jgi:hypothetical protein
MLYEAQKLTTRRAGYPSDKWKPEAKLASSPRRIRPRWNRAFFIDSGCFLPVAVWAGALMCLVDNNPSTAWAKFIVVPCAVVSLVVPAFLLPKEIKVLRFGVPAEGQILGISDDGVDRLFTIYYQDSEVPFQAAITPKNNPHARNWQTGDSITLILEPRSSGDMQKFVIYPPPSYEILN